MVKKSLAAVSVALLIHGIAQAAGADPAAAATSAANASAPAGTWAAQGQLGLIVARSNTTTKSGNASFAAAHSMGRWTRSGGLAGLYARTGSFTTQQDTNAQLQADLQLSKRTFWFSTARWDRNLFTGFRYQQSVASGGGFNFIQTPATQLSGELGAGYRREQPEILTTDAVGAVTSRTLQPVVKEAVAQAALKYQHSITPSTKLLNTILVESGSSDTTTTDNLSLQVKVDATLSLAVGMQLVNNTNPPPGSARHTDTVMTVNLVYALKNPKLSATEAAPQAVSDLSLP
jgi:putative salt-induced outer membrane protein